MYSVSKNRPEKFKWEIVCMCFVLLFKGIGSRFQGHNPGNCTAE